MKNKFLRKTILLVILLLLASVLVVRYNKPKNARNRFVAQWNQSYPTLADTIKEGSFYDELASAAVKCTNDKVEYDNSFFKIKYPGGDVLKDKGVCTDHVIRAYRILGIDLQKEVHEDMQSNFNEYPKIWGLRKTDTNIDHRRVPNLMVFFKRHGGVLKISKESTDYFPGDIVCWNLGGGVTHIGIVSNKKARSGRYLIAHNISNGQVLEDVLFGWQIIGHFRYRK